jgi:hypothetical protein
MELPEFKHHNTRSKDVFFSNNQNCNHRSKIKVPAEEKNLNDRFATATREVIYVLASTH